ncbi:MAG: NAD(P)-binding domain-containing protein [Duncaniella sp.]|nr:NAD(P)-binding domain-containing protein [Duncaniella sp.]MDE5734981.1 NAD(P)-binding domain-containing protein [Duncaniella sp.]MDE6390307.1 NAD(P)-binding domain-containing protein [Duncaniella sp.]
MKISVIGAGAMGGAVAAGIVANGVAPASDVTVSLPHPDKASHLAGMGIHVTSDNLEAARGAGLLFIAVKPWVLPGVVAGILPVLDPAATEVCVIAAGIPGGELEGFFGDVLPGRLSIGMPNTAVSLSQSMTFVTEVRGEAAGARRVFDALGKCMVVPERLLPGATALASCGIAYALRYIRAASEGGVELGFRASEAMEIVAQTVKGAAALLERPGAHPEAEIDRVTTPGGITIRGLNAMERAGFTAAVIEGLKASAL